MANWLLATTRLWTILILIFASSTDRHTHKREKNCLVNQDEGSELSEALLPFLLLRAQAQEALCDVQSSSKAQTATGSDQVLWFVSLLTVAFRASAPLHLPLRQLFHHFNTQLSIGSPTSCDQNERVRRTIDQGIEREPTRSKHQHTESQGRDYSRDLYATKSVCFPSRISEKRQVTGS